jgi:hypothetical protein
MKLIKLAAFLLCISAFQKLAAQEDVRSITNEIEEEEKEEEIYKPFDFNLQVKNMHLWKGLRVTDAPMTAADVHYISKNGKFKAGVWGGAGFTGEYTEFDYYVSFENRGFSVSIWNINNFSDFPGAEIFNYDREETSHFIDVSLGYEFSKIPLKFSWSTLVQGRDTYVTNDGDVKNAFSNYVEIAYTILDKKDWSLGAYVGGAFSFRNEAHFYGEHPNLTNIGLIYNKDVKVSKNFELPVSAMAMWNPEQQYGAIQVAVNFF